METAATAALSVLVIDDEAPALDELAYLLRHDPRIGEVGTSDSATDALRQLRESEVDAVFLDIRMPGLSGIELAEILSRFKQPPALVFVTAHDEHAVQAFDLDAVDYLLKPVRAERVADAVRRVLAAGSPAREEPRQIAVERGGVTRFVAVADVRFVEAEGDYARLHTERDSFLVRVSLAQLEEQWAELGFVRIHRSVLVSRPYVEEIRGDSGRWSVLVGGRELPISRRYAREVRAKLVGGSP